jgi:hypothetical protein
MMGVTIVYGKVRVRIYQYQGVMMDAACAAVFICTTDTADYKLISAK